MLGVQFGTDEFMTHSWKGGLQFQEQVNGEWYDVETQDSESCLNCTQAMSIDCMCTQRAFQSAQRRHLLRWPRWRQVWH